MSEKQLEDLTNKELLEDLAYYVKEAQMKSPPFVDSTFECVWADIKVLQKRFKQVSENEFVCKYKPYNKGVNECTFYLNEGDCSLTEKSCWLPHVEDWFDDFINDVKNGVAALTKENLISCVLGALNGLTIDLKKEVKEHE